MDADYGKGTSFSGRYDYFRSSVLYKGFVV